MKTETITVAKLGRIVTGKTPPTKDKDNYGGTIPFITPVDMTGNRSIIKTERYVTAKGLGTVRNCYLPEHSVCVSCIGSDMGKTVLTTAPSITNQQINSIVVDEDAYDYMYVYYLMRTLEEKIKSLGKNATAVPILNKTKFSNIEIQVPEIDVQRSISNILSAYDNLIENNEKQIKLLEEAAQRLYKEWFVDLRFPGYENTPIVDGVPEGWNKVGMDTIAPIVTGKKDANFGAPNGKYLFFTCAQEPIKAPSYSFDCDAVILAGNGDFNVKLYRGQFEAYQRTYVFSPYESKHLYLLYHAVRESMRQLFQGASGSTIKFLTKHMLENIAVFVPDKDTLNAFSRVCDAIQQKNECLRAQIIFSQEARDRLLPKLMSGEIEV